MTSRGLNYIIPDLLTCIHMLIVLYHHLEDFFSYGFRIGAIVFQLQRINYQHTRRSRRSGRVKLGNTPETPEYADSGVNRGLIPGCNLGC